MGRCFSVGTFFVNAQFARHRIKQLGGMEALYTAGDLHFGFNLKEGDHLTRGWLDPQPRLAGTPIGSGLHPSQFIGKIFHLNYRMYNALMLYRGRYWVTSIRPVSKCCPSEYLRINASLRWEGEP